ncbi:MAG: glycoside hydrolase family 44 protein [Opitutaceae bacterium]
MTHKRILFLSFLFLAALQARAEVLFYVNLSGPQTPISPLVYGLNDWSRNATSESTGFTLERMGGNRMTGYNWENNFSNAGSDYIHHSDNLLVNDRSAVDQARPGEAVMLSVNHARGGNRPSLITLQLAGYVAADGAGTVSEAQTAPGDRWKSVRITKGGPLMLQPDLADDFVYLDEEVNFLVHTYGTASEGGVFAYSLDNEPALWPHTHPRIHPQTPTVKEIVDIGADCAAMVKELDPDALIFGPALYGWGAFEDFQSAPDWSTFSDTYDWFISAYLGEMNQRSVAAGRRLLDVLDIHYYPEASVVSGTDGSGGDVYTRVTDHQSDFEPLTQARLQAPRSLWDPGYTEESWITQWRTQGPIQLLPRVFGSINTHYPDTGLSISEYDFGGRQNYSGGLAQADVLGIFGSYGVFAACYWGEVDGFIIPAFQLFRDYDGNGGTFGDISVPAVGPDAAAYSIYASIDRTSQTVHLVLINKTQQAEKAVIDFDDETLLFAGMRAYGFSEATGPEMTAFNISEESLGGRFTVDLPARSAVHYVLEPPAFKPGHVEMKVNGSRDGVDFVFRPDCGSGYLLEKSQNLVVWDDLAFIIAGDGQVHLIREFASRTSRQFWRLSPND